MPKFLDDLKDKAQSAINATPLAAYVPSAVSGSGSGSQSPGSARSHALDTLQHQIRSLQVQYGSGASKDLRQLQLIITGQKGHILSLQTQAQEAKSTSKEFYIWGQTEAADLKDVSDRLAYLTFVQGALAATLASALDAARAPLKALRDAEAHMQPRRNVRVGLELQISKLRNEGKPGTGAKVRELEGMLRRAEEGDEAEEREIEVLKRRAVVESERMKWEAVREASTPLLDALPPLPPSKAHPYTGAPTTAATRTALQKALDTYTPGTTALPRLPTPDSDSETDTRSFGETHASELSRIGSSSPGPRSSSSPGPGPVNPLALNNAPAPIPIPASPDRDRDAAVPTPAISSEASEPQSALSLSGSSIPSSGPTVAETGVPLAAGREGPGPASGSLAGGRGRQGGGGGGADGGGDGCAACGGEGGPRACEWEFG
ncbi:hypothetical protein K439DRAFT_1343054 [Ramaria rubella]|nr:hypothetical protein K439DRAFT_1343054 [Ramaria rubella]